MASPPAYLDECIDYNFVARLRGRGFDLRHVHDEQTSGRDDEQQLEHAAKNHWGFVSQNQREFQQRHHQWQLLGRQHSGLILVQQRDLPLLEIRVVLLLDWVAVHPQRPSFLLRWHDLEG